MLNSSNYAPSNFELKLELMEGVSIIETNTLQDLVLRITNMEKMLMELIRFSKEIVPTNQNTSVPGFITVQEAAKKYHFSKTTIHNRINLFKKVKGREIDRLQTGTQKQVNEVELLEALRLKSPIPIVFMKNHVS
jgi:hypothetical protein